MKKLFLLSAILIAGVMYAQTTYIAPWQDVSVFSSGNIGTLDGGAALTVDGSGNVYTVGTFARNVTVGSVSFTNNTADGTRDIYVAKYNKDGVFQNAIQLGSAIDDEAFTIAYKDGFLFVGALVNDSGMIYKITNSTLSISIARNLGWLVHPRSIVSYGTNRLVVGGSFYVFADLPTSSSYISLTSSSSSVGTYYDSFTGIIDMSAYFTFAGNPHSSTNDNEIMSISCRNGYIYATGYFEGQMQWDNGGTNMTAAGVRDLFVASVYISTSVNQINFANDQLQAGSIETQPVGPAGLLPDWKECGYGITSNGTAIYVTGNLNNASTPLFDGNAYVGAGAFVARIDYSGSQLGNVIWVRASETCGTTTAVIRSIGYGITADANGNIFATGAAYGDVELEDGSSNVDLCVSGNSDRPGFICQYDPSGNILSADAINQDPETGMRCEGKAILANGCEVFVTGWVGSTTNFQAGNLAPLSVSGGQCAAFIFEINRDGSVASDVTRCTTCPLFPINGSLSVNGGAGATYSWSPGTYLGSTTSATPSYTITTCTATIVNYTITIINSTCTTSTELSLETTLQPAANAGADRSVCPTISYTLGTTSNPGFTYSWAPSTGLSSTTAAQPGFSTAVPLGAPITFTLTQTDVCGNVTTDQVTVSNSHGCRLANPNQPSAEIFPNPSAGIFNVNLPVWEEESDVEFVVTDLSGRVVQQSTVTTAGGPVALDLSGEATGVYMLAVTRNGVTEMHKLIVE